MDRILDAGIIELVEESEWIISIVVKYKKTTDEVWICVNIRKLNYACLHDPFSTPFIDEVLESVGGQDIYSFMDGFSRYHQIRITKEDRHKKIFAAEWGCFQYTVMPFGLKNAPAIFSRIVVATFNILFIIFLRSTTTIGLYLGSLRIILRDLG